MKYFMAQDFLSSGYLIRNINWKPNEFLALSIGGEVDMTQFNYEALGVSSLAAKILLEMNRSNILTIEPHIMKFTGAEIVNYEYILTTKEQLLDEWGIFDGGHTDILNWVEKTKLTNGVGTELTVKKSLPNGEVLTESLNGKGYSWYPIFYLYNEQGFRVKTDKSNWN